MKISELISKLEEIKKKEGDLNVCVSESHEYWGSVYSYLDEYNISISTVQPNGPKSNKYEKSLVFSYD